MSAVADWMTLPGGVSPTTKALRALQAVLSVIPEPTHPFVAVLVDGGMTVECDDPLVDIDIDPAGAVTILDVSGARERVMCTLTASASPVLVSMAVVSALASARR